MTRTQKALLSLLRAGLWEREPDEQELFPLSEEEWQDVYRMAKEQTVSGIVFQGVCLLEDDKMPTPALLNRWVVNVDHIEDANRRVNKVQQELLDGMNNHALRPIVLKGQGVAQMYEKPLQRTSGDIDLYFKTEKEFDRARMLMERQGANPRVEGDGAVNYRWRGVEVEHHRNLLDIYNPWVKGRVGRLITEEGFDGIYPSPLLNLLLLNTHILKHLLGHGIGLRQLADMARACHHLRGQFSTEKYERTCQELGISPWAAELNGMLVDVMGLPEEELPCPALSRLMQATILDKVMNGGNFGMHSTSRGAQDSGRLCRKWHTAKSIVKGWKLARRLAPRESMGMMLHLFKGNFGRLN